MAEPPVVNASPFIVLATGGRLDLLRAAGTRIRMPRRVEQEVQRRGPGDAAVEALHSAAWLEIVDPGVTTDAVLQHRLDPGEAAVLTWALARPGTVAIIDDLRGRRAARALGIPVVGTLGLVLNAKRQGTIPAARPVIKHLLHMTGWYLSSAVLDAALARAGE